jgi:hypothetical protein
MTDDLGDSTVAETMYASAVKLLDSTPARENLPEGGIYDHEIAEDTGEDLQVVREALKALAPNRLNVEARPDDAWVVFSGDRAL